ncbi:homoserine kinase [Clostridioides sp. ZZV15-6388]|uniref:homoserine kinase n=1 Tax=unclassified Clostridioides TaxID=2635829 RepID=UPI001D1169FF|nr:homoserine kinase [Clostridioides sp. ZZV15-6388]MCC0664390.1 homoserine kinase [Clostridioides sp. ZZV15-6597]
MLEIIVPATSANIGPGFDCLGIALNIYNKFYVEEIESGLEIEGCEDAYKNENNLVYTSMKYFFDRLKPAKIPAGIKIKIQSDVPICRGLGSSASCIVAGVIAANALSNANLDKCQLLNIASEIEGHPDNVAPAILGNMVVSVTDNDNIHYDIIEIPNELKFCAMIPNFKLSTEKARGVLPKEIPYSDGVFNVSRVALLVSALLNKNFDLLKVACQDKLHQDYRGTLIENYSDIVKKSEQLNSIGVFLSGAGPTIMALIKENDDNFVHNMRDYLSNLNSNWEIKELCCDSKGAVLNIL